MDLQTEELNDLITALDGEALTFSSKVLKEKVTSTLELKGYIERELSVKNNRPVKIVKITDLGKNIYNETYAKLEPHHKIVKEKIANTDLAKVGELLRELREVLEDSIDIDI